MSFTRQNTGIVVLTLFAAGLSFYSQKFESKSNFIHENIFKLNAVNIPNRKNPVQSFFHDRLDLVRTSPVYKTPIGFSSNAIVYCTDQIKNYTGKRKYKTFICKSHLLNVVSLSVNPDDLFGFENGIYIPGKEFELRNYFKPRQKWWDASGNYQLRGKESDREAYVEFINTLGKVSYCGKATIRINGNATRAFPQKSLRLKLNQKAESAVLGLETNVSQTFAFKNYILRNGGNDWGKTLFNDAVIHEICSGLQFDIHHNKMSVVYINGIYWGIHNLCERTDESFVAETNGCSKKKVVFLENNLGIQKENPISNDLKEFYQTICRKDLKDSEKLELWKNKFDYNGLLQYLCVELYFGNRDWPFNNVKCYAIKGKNENELNWRFILHDMDLSFGYFSSDIGVNYNSFTVLHNGKSDLSLLFNELMKLPQVRNDLSKCMDQLFAKQLSRQNCIEKINSFHQQLLPEMENHCNRWRKPGSVTEWESRIENMRHFIEKRQKVFINQWNQFSKGKGVET